MLLKTNPIIYPKTITSKSRDRDFGSSAKLIKINAAFRCSREIEIGNVSSPKDSPSLGQDDCGHDYMPGSSLWGPRRDNQDESLPISNPV